MLRLNASVRATILELLSICVNISSLEQWHCYVLLPVTYHSGHCKLLRWNPIRTLCRRIVGRDSNIIEDDTARRKLNVLKLLHLKLPLEGPSSGAMAEECASWFSSASKTGAMLDGSVPCRAIAGA